MQVRHNTALLEQAVQHIIRSAAIPALRAEAEASERLMRAQAFRRLATGCAIAAAAIGLGIGIYLAKDKFVANPNLTASTDISSKSAQKVSPEHPPQQDTRLHKIDENKYPAPQEEIVTTNFSRFTNKTISMFGQEWKIEAGHYYMSERDSQWQHAWCYTSKNVHGVAVDIDLVTRLSPESKPIGPGASDKTLSEAGLSELDALSLATKCAWLDNRTFGIADIAPPHDQPQPLPDTSPSFTLVGNRLIFRGPIEDGFSAQLKNYQFREFQIESIGGSLVQAMEGGRYLRQNGIGVQVTEECMSACVLVLSGGLVRDATLSAKIGVHRFSTTVSIDGNTATEAAQQMSSTILQYLSQMGIEADLFHAMAAVPSDEIVLLPHDRLREWNLLGSKRDIEERKLDLESSAKPNATIASGELTRYLGRDMTGGDYRKISQVRLSECESSCKSDEKCRALTYDRWNKLCFLKSEVSPLRREPKSIVSTKPNTRVQFDASGVSFFLRKKRAFPDKPFRIMRADNFGECLSICGADDECEAINFTSASNSCALVKNVSPYRESQETDLGMKLQAP